MKKNKKLNFFSFILFIGLSSLLDLHTACAAADDDYNFSWLDPDKKIYVLQNRKFRKAQAAQISLMGGIGLAETYRNAYQVQPRLGYWFNEDMGIEAFYAARFNSPNGAYRALTQAVGSGTSPLIREINSQVGVLFNWAPWYAKINVFNSILYFDWYFSLGLGDMMTQIGQDTPSTAVTPWISQNLFAVYAGTGHMFHISEHFFGRLDFLGHFYSAKVFGNTGDQAIFSAFDLNLGIGLRL